MSKQCAYLICMKPPAAGRKDGCCSDECAAKRTNQIRTLSSWSLMAQSVGDLFQSPHEPEAFNAGMRKMGFDQTMTREAAE